MATIDNYKKYVVSGGCYRQGLMPRRWSRRTRSVQTFEPGDYPEKWNMGHVGVGCQQSNDIFLKVGYIHCGPHQINIKKIGYSPSFYSPCKKPPAKYWWCRDGDWVPLWGAATKQRSELVKEIRAYWIKKVLLETTDLPEDIIEMVPEYFE